MKENQIIGSGTQYHKNMSPEVYRNRINTPARNPDYFKQFHKLMIERAKAKFGSPIHLLDIACGPADQLDFIKDDKDVKIIATDISLDILSHVKSKLGPNANVFVGDVSLSAIKENIAEAGILLNAVIYAPDKMLETMYGALRPGGQCAVNFGIYGLRQTVTSFILPSSGKISNQDFKVQTKEGSRTFQVKVLDMSEALNEDGSPDIVLRQLAQQLYFQNINDVRELIRMVGFKEVQHSKFKYLTPSKFHASTDVFILEKPL